MKKVLTAAALVLGLYLCLTAALASGGDAGDSLISLSYLEGSFSQVLENAITARLDSADQAVRDSFPVLPEPPFAGTGATLPSVSRQTTTLKEGDALSGSTGLSFLLLGGAVGLEISSGAVVDITVGREASSGLLERGHRYLLAENASAVFTVSSAAAVVSWEGGGALTRSPRPDYFAIAKALRSLNLFRGSGSGIGEGFDLYLAPTRGEGLVMFLRILGEESAALACGYSHPFTDVPAWLSPYVAWAYHQGYANGISSTQFGSERTISAVEYVEFLLRALGRSTAGVDNYATSLERAMNCGALTNGEYIALTEEPFLRAQAAYLSYYILDAPVDGGEQTLAQRMVSESFLTEEQLSFARSQVETPRLS